MKCSSKCLKSKTSRKLVNHIKSQDPRWDKVIELQKQKKEELKKKREEELILKQQRKEEQKVRAREAELERFAELDKLKKDQPEEIVSFSV